jgi:regulatory protein YycI of two-component signal transduction system YycFG
MRKITNQQILIIILCVICVFLGYILNNNKPIQINDKYIQSRLDSLKSENISYFKDIEKRNKQVVLYKTKIDSLNKANDSLQKLKNKIIYTIGKYENFKSYSYTASADTMQSIFSENNIK